MLAEKNWRYRYDRHLLKHVQSSLKSPEAALAAANAGLEELHNGFDFVRNGQTMKFTEAMRNITGTFETGYIKGKLPHFSQIYSLF